MILERYEQQPNDRIARRISYVKWLRTGEVIANSPPPTIEVSRYSGEVDDSGSPFILDQYGLSSDDNGDRVYVDYMCHGGASGNTYKLTVTITTDIDNTSFSGSGQQREDEILIKVKEV